LVTLIIAICVLLSALLSLVGVHDAVNADADHSSINEIARWPMALAAVILLLLGLLSLFLRRAWLAGLRLLVGIWLVVSPWVIGQVMGPLSNLIVIAGGTAVIAVAAFDLFRDARHEVEELSHLS
jgi:uncharacterized BrkB/YihY/UPF0761 family membrane protein